MSAYQPVPCGVHSEYELLAMHQARVRLTYVGDDAVSRTVGGRVLDVMTRDQAEYLLLAVAGEKRLSIRLDKIRSYQNEDGNST